MKYLLDTNVLRELGKTSPHKNASGGTSSRNSQRRRRIEALFVSNEEHPMVYPFDVFSGTPATGADALRENMRWTRAELRWRAVHAPPRSVPTPPVRPRGALRRGAQLTLFTQA